jgi:hypothetical protein
MRRTMYLVASLYVGAGFFVTIPAAAAGETLTAFLGFLVISGALAATAMVSALWQVIAKAAAMEDKLQALAEAVETLNRDRRTATMGSAADDTTDPDSTPTIVDLTDAGLDDPSTLAAAELDRDVYPRLVSLIDDGPPPTTEFEPPASARDHHPETADDAATLVRTNDSNGSSDGSIRNLMRSWSAARNSGDLGACRSIFAALADTADPDLVETMHDQLAQLSESTKNALRDRFADHVRAGELGGAIEAGERLRELFPDSTLADEYNRLKPILLRRMESHPARPSSAPGNP